MLTQPGNPYQSSRPITKPEDLFGRKTEFELVYQMILSGESINVMGPRRIGKSSFLKVLPKPEIQKQVFEKQIFDEHYIFNYIDMESQKKVSPFNFLTKLTQQLSKTGLDINPDIQSYSDFEKIIEKLTDQKKRLIILLDEFDCVAKNEQFDIQFFDMLRYYQQQYLVLYIVASTERIKKVSKSAVTSSPFFNIFRFLRLGLLTKKEAENLICKDDSLSLHKHFVRLITGEHPFFISLLCFYIYYFKNTDPGLTFEEINEKALAHFMEEAFDHFIYYWEHISADERVVLKKIVGKKKTNKKEIPELVELEQKALIKEENNAYNIYSYAFEGFVNEISFSRIKEDVTQFFSKNTKAIISIGKYCLDKVIEFKKGKE